MDFNDLNENNNKSSEKEIGHAFRPSLTLSFSVLIIGLMLLLAAAFVGGNRHQGIKSGQSVSTEQTEASEDSVINTHESSIKDVYADTDKEPASTFIYIARVNEGGNISIYLQNGKLYRDLNVPAFTLSPADRERLCEGISIRDDGELSDFIEDILG